MGTLRFAHPTWQIIKFLFLIARDWIVKYDSIAIAKLVRTDKNERAQYGLEILVNACEDRVSIRASAWFLGRDRI